MNLHLSRLTGSRAALGLLSLVAAIVFGTADNGPAAASSMVERHLRVDGIDRQYFAYLPDGYQQRGPLPVVLAFHGGYEMPAGLADLADIQDSQEGRNYIVVYPAGYARSWNTGDCCGAAAKDHIDDVKFTHDLLNDLNSIARIDRRRVYATGYSNGGNMAYHLACVLSNEIAAIDVMSGAMRDHPDQCHPLHAMALFNWHGLKDPISPYNGGMGAAKESPYVPPVADSVAFWVRFDGTTSVAHETRYGGAADCDIYSGGRDGTKVELCRLPGMGHRWPGSHQTARSQMGDVAVRRFIGDLGPYLPGVPANDAMLQFFAQYSLPAASGR